jgi:hypothetical protein
MWNRERLSRQVSLTGGSEAEAASGSGEIGHGGYMNAPTKSQGVELSNLIKITGEYYNFAVIDYRRPV